MQTPIKNQQLVQPTSLTEHILVVKRDTLFNDGAWHGLKQVNFDEYLTTIQNNKEFLPRTLMEEDETYKQIIPYLVFENDSKYFLMQRQAKASEKRLQNKFTLGIGGHIRQEDLTTNNIFDWARREFYEEVNYTDSFDIEPLGILNDDSNAVGRVHVGFVFLLRGNSSAISVKSELKSGTLVSLQECQNNFDTLESWSQHVVNYLLSK